MSISAVIVDLDNAREELVCSCGGGFAAVAGGAGSDSADQAVGCKYRRGERLG